MKSGAPVMGFLRARIRSPLIFKQFVTIKFRAKSLVNSLASLCRNGVGFAAG
jgi:hypothetical protein